MKKMFLSFLFLAASGLMFSAAGFAEGESYFTKVNIWYEKPQKILSTNYHKGAMLSVGTEVEIIKSGEEKIKFREKATGSEFRIILVKNFTNLNESEFFSRYFSKENILKDAEYAAFSEAEKEHIKNGTIAEGMSKAATLVAYGYPPTHRTPSTKENVWTYWKSRLGNFMVQFKDDKISSVAA